MLTQAELKRIWHYDPDTGLFTRLIKTNKTQPIGDVANCHDKDGYIVIGVDKKALYMTGEWPKGQIDHKFGIRDDNRWSELRDATPSINQQNRRVLDKRNKSGYQGVSWDKRSNKWRAYIAVNNKLIHLGHFDNVHEAGAYRLQKKKEIHTSCPL
jgi:AP2 domain